MQTPFIVLFTILLSSFSNAENRSLSRMDQINKLGSSIEWKKLLEYKNVWEKDSEGLIDTAYFYLDANGKYNSVLELQKFIELIESESPTTVEEISVQCRFPARYHWLKSELPQISRFERPCPHFQSWFQTLTGESISLVFSSYYLNNPSSTFGHTLLRINKPVDKDGVRHELLDYGVNYAANPNTENAVLFAIYGLLGGFPGSFSTIPYYYKVREYNNAESRDLWDYQLNLTQEEVDQFVRHVWELGPHSADYWYLTENCSFLMFTMLEAAAPRLDLTQKLKKFVIPTDTVQVAWNTPGLVSKVSYRPSIRSELFQRLSDLTENERKDVAAAVYTLDPQLLKMQEHKNREYLMLDAALDGMDFRYPRETQISDSQESKVKNEFLMLRSKINRNSPQLKVNTPESDSPHLGHGSRRIQIRAQNSQQEGESIGMHYRFALHDFLDPQLGYPDYASITFFDLQASYFTGSSHSENTSRLLLDRMLIFGVNAISPMADFSRSPSWGVELSIDRVNSSECWSCYYLKTSGNYGYAVSVGKGIDLFAGVRARAFTNGVFHLGAAPALTLRTRVSKKCSALFEAARYLDTNTSYHHEDWVLFETQYQIGKDLGMRLRLQDGSFDKNYSLAALWYY